MICTALFQLGDEQTAKLILRKVGEISLENVLYRNKTERNDI